MFDLDRSLTLNNALEGDTYCLITMKHFQEHVTLNSLSHLPCTIFLQQISVVMFNFVISSDLLSFPRPGEISWKQSR